MSMFTRHEKGSEPRTTGEGGEAQSAAPQSGAEPTAAPRQRQKVPPSVISAGLKVTGNLESDGEIQVDGTVEGDVRGHGVTVGDGATVKGAVYGETVQLAGSIEGRIEARSVTVNATGHMEGDIVHERLQVESGAYVDGHCRPTYGKSGGTVRSLKSSTEAAQPEAKAGEKPGEKAADKGNGGAAKKAEGKDQGASPPRT